MSTALDSNIAALLAILKPSIADHLTAECDCCISDQRSAEQWLEKLSPSNHADNAIELYRLMPSIVKHNCDGKTKIAILDSLAPTVIKTTECLLQNRLNQNTAKAISLGQALLRQLFEGYRLTLFQLGQSLEKSALYQNHDTVRVIAQSIVNAGSLLARIQLNSLSHYLQQPTFFWHQLHSLYLLSEQLGTATTELPNNLGSKTSIAKLYIKILLFSCTRPHHFSRHELRTVYTQLDFWSSYAELRRGGVPGLFSIDPSSNQGAVYSDESKKQPGHLILDTSQLVAFLNQIMTDNSDTLFSDRVSRRVIRDLIQQWGEKRKRRETHIKDHAQVSLTQGFGATLCMLSKTDSFADFLRLCGEQAPLKEYEGNGTMRADDAWGTLFERVDRHPDEPVIYMPPGKRGPRLKVLRALRINVSLNGACVELSDKNVQLQPCELIAVHTAGSNKWTVGIIRWKQISPSLYTSCGLQFPARHCAPAAVRITLRGADAGYQYLQAVLLSPKRDLSEGVTLLCQPLRYTKNSKITIITPLQQTYAVLEQELETTEHLSHFKITFC